MPPSPGLATAAGPSYRDHPPWLRYQEFFPGGLRLTEDSAPTEQWWPWRGMTVHLDRVPRPHAPATLVALHGVGGYGRMLAPFGRLPCVTGLEFLAPDLPGFGLTDTARRTVTYRTWVDCVVDLIEARRRVDPRPIVLLGLSTGGRLAYDVAALAGDAVAGVIATCLLDPRRAEARRCLSARPGLWTHATGPMRSIRAPLRWLANIGSVSNQSQFAKLVWADPLGGATRVPLGFVRSYAETPPTVEPEDFHGPPVLLAHPGEDRWTPTLLSRRFIDRVATDTRFALLNGAGHLPIEESGLGDLDSAVGEFLDEFTLR